MSNSSTQPESNDEALSLNELESISGAGPKWDNFKDKAKVKAKKVGDFIESTWGDGDGVHEVSDYKDEAGKIIAAAMTLGVQAGKDGKPCTDPF